MHADKWSAMHDELSRKTVKELREIARAEGICFGYAASRKDSMVREIVSQLSYREAQS